MTGLVLSPLSLWAQTNDGPDTRLRLDQQLDQRRAAEETKALREAEPLDGTLSVVIDGETYAVGGTVDDVGKALYISVTRKQWRDVRRFLSAYLQLEGRDPALTLYAQGALARSGGDFAGAEKQYRELLKLNPAFLPGQLELARVLFENRKDRDAQRAFTAIRDRLANNEEQAQGILRTVEAFLDALKKRQGWQVNLSAGPSYSDNINQSSASRTCLLLTIDGECLFERKLPDAIKAAGISFEGGINRRVAIGGHNGVRARTIFFGDIYPDYHEYSQSTVITRLGYDYQAAKDGVSISPSFDLGTLGSSVLYRAWGANVEWTHIFSPRILARLEANYRNFDYRLPGYQFQDRPLTDVSLTSWYAPVRNLTLFAGLDFAVKEAPLAVDAYQQWGARLGISKAFGPNANILLIGSYRHRDFRAYSALFEARRRDDQFNATAIVSLSGLKFAGLTPEIVVQHNRVESNIDWLYSYKRTSASMRLSYAL